MRTEFRFLSFFLFFGLGLVCIHSFQLIAQVNPVKFEKLPQKKDRDQLQKPAQRRLKKTTFSATNTSTMVVE